MTSPYLHRQKRNLSEFKKVSELDDWFEAYSVELMPNIKRHRPRLISMPAFWLLLAMATFTVGGAVLAFVVL